jgi:hypothetical protein
VDLEIMRAGSPGVQLDAKAMPLLPILRQVKPFDRAPHHAIIAEIAEAFLVIT